MALNINGRMKVKTLRADFKEEFGLTLRVYDGRGFAEDDATLASIRKGDSKGGEFAPGENTKIVNLEEKIIELFGIKVQIAGSDDGYLCDNDLTLTGALEADEKKMGKKVERDQVSITTETEDSSNIVTNKKNIESQSIKLSDEKRDMLKNLWDESHEIISNEPIQLIFKLLVNEEDETIFEILKEHNDQISIAVKNEFEQVFKKAKSLAEEDGLMAVAVYDIRDLFLQYDSFKLSPYNENYEIERNLDRFNVEYPLWKKIKEKVNSEIIGVLEEYAETFDDYKLLTDLVVPEYKYPTPVTETNFLNEYYNKLVQHLDEVDDIYDLIVAYKSDGYWDLWNNNPDAEEKLMEYMGQKMLDMDIAEVLRKIEDTGVLGIAGALPEDVKSDLLQRIESLDNEEKEKFYYLDEIIESLKE